MTFGVWMNLIDLNAVPRLFDITLTEQHFTGINLTNSVNIPLVPCSGDHYNFNTELYQLKDKFPLHWGLCPQVGQQLTVSGKVSSAQFVQLSL